MLEPALWYRARIDEGAARTADEFEPPDPHRHRLAAGRFNSAGQLGAPPCAGARAGRDRSDWREGHDKESLDIGGQSSRAPKAPDLTIQIFGTIHQQPLVINSLVYSGALSNYGDDQSPPQQYRVPQFIADILRHQKIDGLLYTRRRDSGFPNPEAWGTQPRGPAAR